MLTEFDCHHMTIRQSQACPNLSFAITCSKEFWGMLVVNTLAYHTQFVFSISKKRNTWLVLTRVYNWHSGLFWVWERPVAQLIRASFFLSSHFSSWMIHGKPHTMDKIEGSSVFFMLSVSVDSSAKSKSDDLAHENSNVSKLG